MSNRSASRVAALATYLLRQLQLTGSEVACGFDPEARRNRGFFVIH